MVFAVTGMAVAQGVVRKPSTVKPSGQIVMVPSQATDNAEFISLGTAVDPTSGKVVEGYAIIHYKNNFAKPPWAGGGSKKTKSSCYSFFAKDAKWKEVELWIMNPANSEGLSSSFLLGNLTGDIDKWEDAANFDILGNGSLTTSTLSVDMDAPDGNNEVYFADVSTVDAIAVTVVWGIFGGPPFARELTEWDMVFDDTDYDWSSTGEAGKMDFENIATHELGHAVGMSHPENSCTEETMYWLADFGETKKQTLNQGDIDGVGKLY